MAAADRRLGPDQQVAVARETLGTVRHAAVFQHGAHVVDGHVRWVRQRHLVPVDLDDTAHPEYFVGRVLGRVQLEEPVQVVGHPDLVRLVLGPAATTGAVRLQPREFGPHVRVVVLLVQAPDHRDRLVAGMRAGEVFYFHLYASIEIVRIRFVRCAIPLLFMHQLRRHWNVIKLHASAVAGGIRGRAFGQRTYFRNKTNDR